MIEHQQKGVGFCGFFSLDLVKFVIILRNKRIKITGKDVYKCTYTCPLMANMGLKHVLPLRNKENQLQ